MKSLICLKIFGVFALSLLITYLPAQVKIGDPPSASDPSAILELDSDGMGLLIPRISLEDAVDVTDIPQPANSLLIFNTNISSGAGNDNVSPGFYYWDGDNERWVRLITGSGVSGENVWIDGNQNILSANSEEQTLSGSTNVAIGKGAFGDLNGASNFVVAIGDSACRAENTSGNAFVVAIGHRTAYGNSGFYVNAIGHNTAQNNTGSNLNAFGSAAGENNHGGSVNVMGLQAGQLNSGGDVNAMGARAAQNNTHAGVNAFGLEAAQNNKNAGVNALGFWAAQNNLGKDVQALGEQAARENTNSHVVAIGDSAAYSNQGWCVVALGWKAAALNNGDHTVAIGERALYGHNGDGGEGNVAIGWNSAHGLVFGAYNVAIGHNAADTLASGDNNIAIGYNVGLPDGSANNQINIGNSIIKHESGVIELKDLIQLPILIEPPSNPEPGMIYFDGTKLYCCVGSTWQALW